MDKQEVVRYCICCNQNRLMETYVLLKLRWFVCQFCRKATTEHVSLDSSE